MVHREGGLEAVGGHAAVVQHVRDVKPVHTGLAHERRGRPPQIMRAELEREPL